MARRHNVLQGAPSTRTATGRFSALSAALLGLAFLIFSPAYGASQEPTEVPDDVFRAQLEAELAPTQGLTAAEVMAAKCEAAMAGPDRERVIRNGDCAALGPVDASLVTITPEPSTMALIAIPAALMMIGVGRRRRRGHLSG